MQKLMYQLFPLVLLLCLFSCAKDQDLAPLPVEEQILQAKEASSKKKPCDAPCRRPDWANVSEVESCSAVFSWGFETKFCGTFVVQLQNVTTGEWTHIQGAVSPLSLYNLDPCSDYYVAVSHVTDRCASVTLGATFTTACEACEKDCLIPCKTPDYFTVDNVSAFGATVTFGHESPTCGHFLARLKNNATGAWTYFDPAASPLSLTDLDPCTSYTVGVAHITDLQACVPSEISFTTECGTYCESEGSDASCLYARYVSLSQDQHPGIWVEDPSVGYLDATDQVINVVPGALLNWTPAGVCLCENLGGPIYIKLWIDLDNDYQFETDEQVYDHNIPQSGAGTSTIGCLDIPVNPGFAFPDLETCGLRARFVVSKDPEAGPCGDFTTGQVVDFTINTAECSGD